jgi:hypothetical protein
VNTPQFSWCRTKLAYHPQPVPPIFQPELIADAITFAAEHRRREIWLAWPAVEAIVSDKIAARIGDRYLAATSFSGQQTDQLVRADRPDNLFHPIAGDYGARGIFNARAKSYSVLWTLSKHRAALLTGALSIALVGGLVSYARAKLAA